MEGGRVQGTWMKKWITMLCLCLLLVACSKKPCGHGDKWINDFERDSSLNALNWHCHTLYSLSDLGVTHGRSALKIVMTPSPYPGVSFGYFPRDWRCFSMLTASFFNPQPSVVHITMRIDDKKDATDYNDRVNLSFSLDPGQNRLEIPMDRLVCPSGRPLDTGHICALMFFTVNPKAPLTLYMDDVRLSAQLRGKREVGGTSSDEKTMTHWH